MSPPVAMAGKGSAKAIEKESAAARLTGAGEALGSPIAQIDNEKDAPVSRSL